MSPSHSITASASFQTRLMQAERWRLALLALCFFVMLIMWEARRLMGDMVAASDLAQAWVVSILLVSIALLIVGIVDVTRRLRRGGSMPWGRLLAGAALDLGAPFGVLLALQMNSPRGAYAALSGPSLLIVPIVIMLSALRLRPLFSIATGISAGLLHWALVARTLVLEDAPPSAAPLLLSYGTLLMLCGVGAAALAYFVRAYIKEAMREAEAAERSSRALHTVEKELDIAREIQMGLLPTGAPDLEAFDIAAMSRPAAKAGGDYYDWQPLPDGRLIVAIADVTGHGIGPALVMAVCRAYARATAPGASSASDLLERLNRLIVEDVKGARFITMALAILHPDGAIDLLSAGHGPTFLYRRAAGSVENFGGDGLPLGVHDAEEYQPILHMRLEPGDALVLLTDGFMERANNKGKLYGSERLRRLISEHGSRSAAQLIEALDRENGAFAEGAPQGDDMTAVVIRRKAPSQQSAVSRSSRDGSAIDSSPLSASTAPMSA